ncbi:uncharacterized protein [Littorina saxatilis]|uniref:Uncharacterized protein n=1 Tax=Littorina saxatilis TaxID=31220 RepID=A0AAN9FWH3_9CAEN
MKSYLLLFLCLALGTFCAVEGLRIIKPSVSSRCRNVFDCGKHECCVVQSPYRGRKKRDLSTQYVGVCKPLGTRRSTCFVGGPNISPPSPLISYNYCPCTFGLSCGGLIYTDVPQGPVGTCQ